MPNSSECRGFAAACRRKADECGSPLIRGQLIAAADRWEALAEEVERSEIAAAEPQRTTPSRFFEARAG